jgi:hypothetical protein
MADGFNNVVEVSDREGFGIVPFIVVHDSFTSNFKVETLFEIYDFCYDAFSNYLYNKSFVRYEFDLKIGDNYYDMTSLKIVDENTLKMSGSKLALLKIYNKIKDHYDVEIDFTEDEVVKFSIDQMLNLEGRPLFDEDSSYESIIIRKRKAIAA